jgi:hypothetical protein
LQETRPCAPFSLKEAPDPSLILSSERKPVLQFHRSDGAGLIQDQALDRPERSVGSSLLSLGAVSVNFFYIAEQSHRFSRRRQFNPLKSKGKFDEAHFLLQLSVSLLGHPKVDGDNPFRPRLQRDDVKCTFPNCHRLSREFMKRGRKNENAQIYNNTSPMPYFFGRAGGRTNDVDR